MCAESQEWQIDELAALVHPRDGHKKLFAMIEAYFDESGIHDGAHACLIAGYCADRSQWRYFEKNWKKVLARENIEEFHAKVFFKNRTPGTPYFKWSKTRWKRTLNDLLSIIESSGIRPISGGVVMRDWERLSHERRRFLTGGAYDSTRRKFITSGAPNQPYFLAFQILCH